MPLLDAHNHVQEEILQPVLPMVLRRARAAGVTAQIVNGTGEQDWADVRRLADGEPGIIPAYGLHPWFVGERSGEWLEVLEEYVTATATDRPQSAPPWEGSPVPDQADARAGWALGNPPADGRQQDTTVAARGQETAPATATAVIGEIGLDRLQAGLEREAQEAVFREQLALATRLGRPVMIHCLKAWGWLLEVLRDAGPPPAGFLVHGYGGAADLLPELTALGGYFSFGGTVLDPARRRARAALLAVPHDRLLIETDAPAMPPPEAYRAPGTEYNEPANLPLIVQGVAQLLGRPTEELATLTWENGERLLGAKLCPTSSS